MVTHTAFRGDDGSALFDPSELVFDGNSQGAIMGGALTALGVDFTRAVLGVPGMTYSTLLHLSLDWQGAYGVLAYPFYPPKAEQQLLLPPLQMLLLRVQENSYATHLTAHNR